MNVPDDVFFFQAPEPGPGEAHCDFCNCAETEPGKDYACETFRFPGPFGITSTGSWWACTPCARLIDAGDWEALAQRAAEGCRPELYADYLERLRCTHRAFNEHRRKVQ